MLSSGPLARCDGTSVTVAAFRQRDIADTELFGKSRHRFGPDQLVQGLAGQGYIVSGHQVSRNSA
jgi:hypothetical protein